MKFKFLRKKRDYRYDLRIPYGHGDIVMELSNSNLNRNELESLATQITMLSVDLTLDKFYGVHLKLDKIASFMTQYASVNALGYESNGTHYKTGIYRSHF